MTTTPAKPPTTCCTGNCRQGRDCPNRRLGTAPVASTLAKLSVSNKRG